eukprot:5739716-Pleurochrysis_carterae.AAC.1
MLRERGHALERAYSARYEALPSGPLKTAAELAQEHEPEKARLEAARTRKEAAKTKSAKGQFKKDVEVMRKRGVALVRKELRKEAKKARMYKQKDAQGVAQGAAQGAVQPEETAELNKMRVQRDIARARARGASRRLATLI